MALVAGRPPHGWLLCCPRCGADVLFIGHPWRWSDPAVCQDCTASWWESPDGEVVIDEPQAG